MSADRLERHLFDTAGIDAPTLLGTLVPLLLYADDLILMSTTAAGLQRQLDALSCFCEQRQLTVNPTKTKVVVFEARGTTCIEFVFNSKVVERHNTYRYLEYTCLLFCIAY